MVRRWTNRWRAHQLFEARECFRVMTKKRAWVVRPNVVTPQQSEEISQWAMSVQRERWEQRCHRCVRQSETRRRVKYPQLRLPCRHRFVYA